MQFHFTTQNDKSTFQNTSKKTKKPTAMLLEICLRLNPVLHILDTTSRHFAHIKLEPHHFFMIICHGELCTASSKLNTDMLRIHLWVQISIFTKGSKFLSVYFFLRRTIQDKNSGAKGNTNTNKYNQPAYRKPIEDNPTFLLSKVIQSQALQYPF